MELLLNDLSLDGQFGSVARFIEALDWVMAARQRIEQQGLALRCPRDLMAARITDSATVQQALQSMADRNKKRRILSWISKHGPFWEDGRLHGGDDYFVLRGHERIVTDTAVGEAAMHLLQGSPRTLMSFSPSDWMCTPVEVERVGDDGDRSAIDVPNVWTDEQLGAVLDAAQRPVQRWRDLLSWAAARCPHLVLARDVVAPLDGWPFMPGVAERVQVLLETLNRVKECMAADGGAGDSGALRDEVKRIFANHFSGRKAWFTDSSEKEKHEFAGELRFPHPERPGEHLFCPWHGKVKIQQIRIHFSFPITRSDPLYVVYIGPKITKR